MPSSSSKASTTFKVVDSEVNIRNPTLGVLELKQIKSANEVQLWPKVADDKERDTWHQGGDC